MYRVTYTKLSKMPNGKIGNISQGVDICYTDFAIEKIEEIINNNLEKYVCVINKIEKIKGHVISKKENFIC